VNPCRTRRPDWASGFLIDTHILDSTDEVSVRLWRDHDDGWIQLCRADVVDTDGSGKRSGLLDRSAIVGDHLGLWIAHPADVVAFVDRLKARYLERKTQEASGESNRE
jgi:hypothetical protein